MAITKLKCPTCQGPAIAVSERSIAGMRSVMYKCGHVCIVKQLARSDFANYISQDGKKPYQFQIDGALFGVDSNARCLIADEMGLGKTVQANMILWSHPKELLKALVLGKAGLATQWCQEFTRWNGETWYMQHIEHENDALMPGAKGYYVSFDSLWRFKDISAFMQRIKAKTIVLDEVQHLKNSGAKRTNGVREACRCVNNILALSGTPIANHAGEYFNILNILHPERFRTKSEFDQIWVDTYWNGHSMKYGGLKNFERFKQHTSDFIIRRTRAEVLPDLPTISREFRFSELGNKVEAAYKELFKQFTEYFSGTDDTGSVRESNILAYLSKMRHLTGIAKIVPCVSFLEDFISSTDRKIVVFTHHKDVSNKLLELLSELQLADTATWGGPILRLPEDPNLRQDTINEFRTGSSRIMLASTLASSEGINLQFCADAVMLERQWTPIKEEQAEARFPRPGQTASAITVTYMVAVGTVDEFLSKLVERKRAACSNTLDGTEMTWQESSIIRELAEVLAQNGGKQWGW
jgi:SWI/SNF-related matrix-associated actin-dependent regulator 1 of chromatin subfamily A